MSDPRQQSIGLPDSFWQREEAQQPLRERDVAAIFRLVQKYTGASQTKIGMAVGMPQPHVSTIMAGKRQVRDVAVFERIAEGLGIPRHLLGLAPEPGKSGPFPDVTGEDPMKRREFLGVAGIAVTGLAEPGTCSDATDQVRAIGDILLPYGTADHAEGEPEVPSLARLQALVSAARQAYAACRYSAVMKELPGLLSVVRHARNAFDGDEALTALSLAADTYHVAASTMLKLGHKDLAWIAADRSMQAASASQDPLTVGSSMRILTHVFLASGYHDRAKETASRAAVELSRQFSKPSPDELSVYGALLLRGAIAAARGEDRAGALELLDEAERAARHLGKGFNHHQTAFGLTNVLVHRAHIAVTLGDAGTALQHARRVDLTTMPVRERQASLWLDVARAYAQWGKYPQALTAVLKAEQLAPEEIHARPAVRRLVEELNQHSRTAGLSEVGGLARRVGGDL
ncbi:hypothetical protein LI90_4051 [Carbonactinospora thermoautotrophica]|uniref:Uncharacterized protein n=1 Tax=Carbonactinospora thermoautotrophica TaxID=1469144 RepID=A0A132N076_9ACTN|nr:helix-turn-helix domain-containing protein [Carbonactinospora thermoautotrophica]KWX03002.1 hypothetical protein LI90_4051 [Carbonactinospora thermoautotrophica]